MQRHAEITAPRLAVAARRDRLDRFRRHIDAGITSGTPRTRPAVMSPSHSPSVVTSGLPDKPRAGPRSVRITCASRTPRPTRTGPATPLTTASLAVSWPSHERNTAAASDPARGSALAGVIGGASRFSTRSKREAGGGIPADENGVQGAIVGGAHDDAFVAFDDVDGGEDEIGTHDGAGARTEAAAAHQDGRTAGALDERR